MPGLWADRKRLNTGPPDSCAAALPHQHPRPDAHGDHTPTPTPTPTCAIATFNSGDTSLELGDTTHITLTVTTNQPSVHGGRRA